MKPETNPMMRPKLIPASEMKNLIPGTTDQSWAAMRHKGTGPAYVKVGRRVFYEEEAIQQWLDSNRYTRTDQKIGA